MATYGIREKTVTTHEIAVPLPSNWVEVEKGMNASYRAYETTYGHGPADNAIEVTSDGEEIVFSFVKTKG